MNRVMQCVIIGVVGVVLALGTGCAASSGPPMLTVQSQDYDAAFDAAVEAARAEGMIAAQRDRRAGVIETEPVTAPSMLEPWAWSRTSRAAASTVAHERLRARFEFVPAGFAAAGDPAPDVLRGPDIIGDRGPAADLTRLATDLELRVWVYVERAHRPGQRTSTWTRRASTQSRIGIPGTEEMLPRQSWTPVTRDEDAERRLLASVSRILSDEGG